MEGNMLKPIVDCVWDVCEIIMKYTKKITSNTTNYNGQDFKKFFKGIGLKNNEEKYPSLISRKYEGIYNIYTFDVPPGLYLEDFNNILKPLAFFMKLEDINLKFKVAEDFSIKLYQIRFNELFKKINLKNKQGVYPKLKCYEEEGNKITYTFSVPKQLTIKEFEAKEKELHKITNIDTIKFKQVPNSSDVKLTM